MTRKEAAGRLPNRYDDMIDPEDEVDFDEWIEMSEDEQNRELDTAMQEFEEAYRRMTPLQRYRRSRRVALRSCMTWRNLRRQNFIPDFSADQIRKAQVRLLKLRIQLATGTYPGEA